MNFSFQLKIYLTNTLSFSRRMNNSDPAAIGLSLAFLSALQIAKRQKWKRACMYGGIHSQIVFPTPTSQFEQWYLSMSRASFSLILTQLELMRVLKQERKNLLHFSCLNLHSMKPVPTVFTHDHKLLSPWPTAVTV